MTVRPIVRDMCRPMVRDMAERIGSAPPGGWRIESLFLPGDDGAIGDISDRKCLYQDPGGELPVVANDDPVGLVLDKSGNGNDAAMATLPARPEYQDGSLSFDLLDDQLAITLGAFEGGTLILAGTLGTWVQQDVEHAGGAFEIGVMDVSAAPAGLVSLIGGVVGWVVIDRELSADEIDSAAAYFQSRGAHQEVVDPAIVGIHRRRIDTMPSGWIRVGSDVLPLGANWQTTINAHPTYAGITPQIIDDQHMVKVPKFWVKTVDLLDGGVEYYISSEARPGFIVHPAFYSSGEEIDQFWIGAHHASEVSNVFESQPNVLPRVSLSGATAITRMEARNNGDDVTGFGSLTWHQICAVRLLCLIEIGTPDPRTAIGEGWNSTTSNDGSGVALQPTGTGDANWRGIYDLWGNVHTLCTGLEFRDGRAWLADENGDLVDTGHDMPATRYIGACAGGDLAWAFLPTADGPTASNAGYTSYQWMNTSGTRAARHGGSFSFAPAIVGLFSLSGDLTLGHTLASYGFRLAKV